MRTKIVAGNWKMNKTASEAAALIEGIKKEVAGVKKVEVVVCPPFTDLKDAAAACAMRSASASEVASGFSQRTWSPRPSASKEHSAWVASVVTTETASRRSRSSIVR